MSKTFKHATKCSFQNLKNVMDGTDKKSIRRDTVMMKPRKSAKMFLAKTNYLSNNFRPLTREILYIFKTFCVWIGQF